MPYLLTMLPYYRHALMTYTLIHTHAHTHNTQCLLQISSCSGLQALQYGPSSPIQSGHHARVGLDAQEESLQERTGEEMARQI